MIVSLSASILQLEESECCAFTNTIPTGGREGREEKEGGEGGRRGAREGEGVVKRKMYSMASSRKANIAILHTTKTLHMMSLYNYTDTYPIQRTCLCQFAQTQVLRVALSS